MDVAERVWNEVEELANEPRPAGCIKLHGIDAWRIRIGDYRVVYEISDNVVTVTVVRVRHRSDVPRQRRRARVVRKARLAPRWCKRALVRPW